MSPVAIRPRPAPLRRKGDLGTVVIAAVVAALALLVVAPAIRAPAFVDRVTVVNPHPWRVEVDVTGSQRAGVVGLVSMGRERTQILEDVMDQGPSWVFRFSYGGVDGGALVVSRAALEQARWTITVPEEFAARMREAGMGPSK